jgi:hypothetical protein
MKLLSGMPFVALAALVAWGGSLRADTTPKKEIVFGALEAVSQETAQKEAEAWLNAAVKDGAMQKRFTAIWVEKDRPLLDKVIDTIALEPAAAKLLADAKDPLVPAPTAVPVLFKDPKQPTFYRANLALAYAKALSNRRVYEEALDTLKTVKPEEVVDPSAYLFHRAVAEHAMLHKEDAHRSIARLLDDVADVPERYRAVGALMLLDMLTWREKDLNWIARKMDNSGRRLELARGGPVTQKIQRDIVNRLDELIKQLENQQKKPNNANGGACPDGGGGGSGSGGGAGGTPMQDSNIATNGGPGTVDSKKFKKIVEKWGTLPERERRAYVQELTNGLSDKHRQAIYNYFKRLSESQRKVKK